MPALMRSELPELARTRHHWVALIRLPGRWAVLGTLVLFVAAIIWPWPMAVPLVLIVGGVAFFRWHTWRAEVIILTRKRIVHVQGVPETTSTEASLRLDRVSGARLIQTVPGKIFDYGTIELEAPGNHPDIRHLTKIVAPNEFYERLRTVVFGDRIPSDPNDLTSRDYVTEPLPRLPEVRRHPQWPSDPRHRR